MRSEDEIREKYEECVTRCAEMNDTRNGFAPLETYGLMMAAGALAYCLGGDENTFAEDLDEAMKWQFREDPTAYAAWKKAP